MARQFSIGCAALWLLFTAGSLQAQRFAASGSYGGAFSSSSSGNSIDLNPTQAGTFLATGEFRIASKVGAQFNYGRTSNSQIYNSPPFNFRVQGTITEYSGTLRFAPFSPKGKWEPFFDAGAGALRFYPKLTFVNDNFTPFGAATQTRPVFIYGAGLDYKLVHGFALRLQYRGLFYSAPNYNISQLTTSAFAHVAEPMVGIVFRF